MLFYDRAVWVVWVIRGIFIFWVHLSGCDGLMWDWVIIFIFFEFIINCWDFIVVSVVIIGGLVEMLWVIFLGGWIEEIIWRDNRKNYRMH